MQIIKWLGRVALFIAPLAVQSQSTYLPQGSRTQTLLDRLEIKRGRDTMLAFSAFQPFSRKQAVRAVEAHDSLWSDVPLSGVD
jgi:hypothetical protein